MIMPVVNNVIGVGQLSNPNALNLQQIAAKVEGSRLNAKKFPGLIVRKTKPKGTILLFKSNKFIIVGAENQDNCCILSKKLVKDLLKILNIKQLKIKDFKISNIVASAHLGYKVGISKIAQLPNAFKDDKSSGVFIRMNRVKCVVVFQSGKVLLNGANKVADIEQIFLSLVKQLQPYRLQQEQIQKYDQQNKYNVQDNKKSKKGAKRQRKADDNKKQLNQNKSAKKKIGKIEDGNTEDEQHQKSLMKDKQIYKDPKLPNRLIQENNQQQIIEFNDIVKK